VKVFENYALVTYSKSRIFAIGCCFVIAFSQIQILLLLAAFCFFYKPSSKDNFSFIIFVAPLLLLLLINIPVTFFSDYLIRDKLRDIYYFGLFFSALYIGVRLSTYMPSIRDFVVLSVVFIVIENILYLKELVFEFQNFENINKLRDALGQRSTLPAILFFPFLAILPLALRNVFLASTFLSFLNFSRSNIVTFFFFFLNLNFRKKVMYTMLALVALPLVLSSLNSTLIQSYLEKTEKTFSELFNKDIATKEDLNERWRAYERYIVEREIDNENVFGQVFGKGLGATAFSDFPKRTDASSTDYIVDIPIFHDSSLFIKLKLGYFGLLIWYVFWLRVLHYLYLMSNKLEAQKFIKSSVLFFFSLFSVVFIFNFSHGYPLMKNPEYISVVIGYLLGMQGKMHSRYLKIN